MNVIAEPQPVIHSTFMIERVYPVPLARVYAAFENPATKRRWFAEGQLPTAKARGLVPGAPLREAAPRRVAG